MNNTGNSFSYRTIQLDFHGFSLSKEECREKAGEFSGSRIYDIWNTIAKRQHYWKEAQSLYRYVSMGIGDERQDRLAKLHRLFERLRVHVHGVHVRAMHEEISSSEAKSFGQAITQAENPYSRLSFWRFVQLEAEGIEPSDLTQIHSPVIRAKSALIEEEHYRQRAKILRESIVQLTDPSDKAMREKLEKQLESDAKEFQLKRDDFACAHPVVQGEYVPMIREWVRLYDLAGYSRQWVSRVIRVDETLCLSRPIAPMDKEGYWAGQGYRPLRWWARYGIMGLKDIKTMPAAGGVDQVFPSVDLSDQKPIDGPAGRRAGYKGARATAHDVINQWPEQDLPLIELMAERVRALDHSSGDSEEELNKLELEIFHQRITHGEVSARTLFWLRLNVEYDRRMNCLNGKLPRVNAYGAPHLWQISVSARGRILSGSDPLERVGLFYFGRAGVSPRSMVQVKSLAWYVGNALAVLNEHFDDYDYVSAYDKAIL